ncbi:hypothetical protein B0H11DRAFT_2065390 [Mycena galericulata]|nr:hypothetical protein B0H11DRAFT_2065390 [Mycena galericulata]
MSCQPPAYPLLLSLLPRLSSYHLIDTSRMMQLLYLKARSTYQNVSAGSCREFAGICIGDAIVLIAILVFVVGLSLLTLFLNLRARLRSIRRDRAATSNSPPPYVSIGFPPSALHDASLYKSGSDSPLDPYHVVPPSLDSSLLLKGDYFTHVSHPGRTFSPSHAVPTPQRPSALPSGVGLGFGSTARTGPSPPPAFGDVALTPPPPAYGQDPRSDTTGEATTL